MVEPNKPLEQDMMDLAREGLASRIKRAQARKWRLDAAKRDLEEMERLNERAVQKLGDPYQLVRERQLILARHRDELSRLGQK